MSRKLSSNMDLINYSATDLGVLIFGNDGLKSLKEKGINATRAIYELSSPTTQCIGSGLARNSEGNNCYICGMDIDPTDIKTLNSSSSVGINQGLTAECEHLLPIAQAIVFLGIYLSKHPGRTPENILKLEYAWAHKTCNQIKSDDVYITYMQDANHPLFSTNKTKIDILLQRIYNNTREDSVKFNSELRKKYRTKRLFIDDRLSKIVSKFDEICTHLNSYAAPGLVLLSGMITALEGPMRKEAREILNAKIPTERLNESGISLLASVSIKEELYCKIMSNAYKLLPVISERDIFMNYIDDIKTHNFYIELMDVIEKDYKDYESMIIPYITYDVIDTFYKELVKLNNRRKKSVEVVRNFYKNNTDLNDNIITEMDKIKNTIHIEEIRNNSPKRINCGIIKPTTTLSGTKRRGRNSQSNNRAVKRPGVGGRRKFMKTQKRRYKNITNNYK